MSADNHVVISKKTFVVRDCQSESKYGMLIGKGKTLEEAIDIANEYMSENIVEYGITFID